MGKTIEEINAKIRSGEAVVFTAEEIIGEVQSKGLKQIAQEVDVVTTGNVQPHVFVGCVFQCKTKQRENENRRRICDAERRAGLCGSCSGRYLFGGDGVAG